MNLDKHLAAALAIVVVLFIVWAAIIYGILLSVGC